ncbi:MAG: DUF2892 domain-containing protein [Chloroflexi bacterium]|nr:DUF2892 domain-containing protein [Chloroflexota bacterium]
MNFIKFMTSNAGRGARVVLGLVIISLGQFVVQGTIGTVMSIVGLIPLSGGVFDFCLIGFAMGYPLKGADARKKLAGN